MANLDSILKSRDIILPQSPSSQGYGFSSGHVWMWNLECEESWAPKNWCFWTVVLEKTLESSLDCKEIQPVHLKGDQSWVFTGRTDVEIKRHFLLRRKAMANLDSILKSRDITLPVNVHIVKAMVFPGVVWMWEMFIKGTKPCPERSVL